MSITEVRVRRKAFAETQLAERPAPALEEGEILVQIDKFALTANNVSYALSGHRIGYWKFSPVEEPWGIVPVWGFADIVESRHANLTVGERMWGFLPMASHVLMRPNAVTPRSFVDGASHRAALPGIYNNYQRTTSDPAELTALEDERCLLFPLFTTSYVLYDYLVDNEFFGAEQVLLGSASSKTGLGLANLLSRHGAGRPRVVALTSPGNVEFVRRLGTCDEILTYAEIAAMTGATPTAFVDMAGSGEVVAAIHARFGANLKLSCAVGATHWESPRYRLETAGALHTFFFAPGQIAKREKNWGSGELLRRAQGESARISRELKGLLTIQHERGPEATRSAFSRLVAGDIPPDIGIIASLFPSA